MAPNLSRAEGLSISSRPGSPRPKSRLTGYKANDGSRRQIRRPLFHAVIIGLVIAAAFYASFLPNRSASRASGFINPSEGLSFSGAAVVVQQQTTALKQTSDIATFQAPAASSQTNPSGQEFVAGGLLPGSNQQPFSAGLLSPLEPSGGVASSLSAEDEVAGPPGEEDVAAAPDGCDITVSELYCVYEVQEGDTLSTIADRFGLESTEDFVNWELLVRSNNSVVVDPDDVSPGLKVIIPRGNGVLHTVLTSQTLTEIADQYGVTVEEIMAVPGNGLSDANSIGIGTEILIPNPKRFAPIYVPDETTAPGDESSSGSEYGSANGDSSAGGPDITGGGPSSAAGFIWPASGPISSFFGPNHPLGIDIDLFNNAGSPISAAMGGVVTFAGGNACCSYGYYVVVDHGTGYQTLYAHLSSIGVSVGEVVAQGQYLGAGGSTGYSTGDHLHFEVHLNGSTLNPLNYLP
jgi:murein DD-endopeptidase MepM/ murein hydrolase activator NlpD